MTWMLGQRHGCSHLSCKEDFSNESLGIPLGEGLELVAHASTELKSLALKAYLACQGHEVSHWWHRWAGEVPWSSCKYAERYPYLLVPRGFKHVFKVLPYIWSSGLTVLSKPVTSVMLERSGLSSHNHRYVPTFYRFY